MKLKFKTALGDELSLEEVVSILDTSNRAISSKCEYSLLMVKALTLSASDAEMSRLMELTDSGERPTVGAAGFLVEEVVEEVKALSVLSVKAFGLETLQKHSMQGIQKKSNSGKLNTKSADDVLSELDIDDAIIVNSDLDQLVEETKSGLDFDSLGNRRRDASPEELRSLAANILVSNIKDSLDNGVPLELGTELHSSPLNTKSLRIGGTGGEGLTLAEFLMQEVTEYESQNELVTSDLTITPYTQHNTRHLRLVEEAGLAKGAEQTPAGVDFDLTPTIRMEQGSHQQGKVYAKFAITTEALADAELVLQLTIESLARQKAKFIEFAALYGDGKPDRNRGIIGVHLDTTESVKDDASRDKDTFAVMFSAADGKFGTDDIEAAKNVRDFLGKLPAGIDGKLYLRPETLAILQDIKKVDGSPILRINSNEVEGVQFKLVSYLPVVATGSVPMLLGNIDKAYKMQEQELYSIEDPYTQDGQVVFKFAWTLLDAVKNNNALRAFSTGSALA